MQQFLTGDADAFGAFLGNDLSIIGVIAVDELGNDVDAETGFGGGNEIESHLVLAELQFNGSRTQQTVQLIDRLGGDDELPVAFDRQIHLFIAHRKAPPIGRHQGHLVFLQAEEDPVQHVPGLVRRHREGGSLEHHLQLLLRQVHRLQLLEDRHGRIVIGRQAVDLEEGGSGADRCD